MAYLIVVDNPDIKLVAVEVVSNFKVMDLTEII
jgi:hypothetical protein